MEIYKICKKCLTEYSINNPCNCNKPKQVTIEEFHARICSYCKITKDQYYDLAEWAKGNNWIKNG